MDYKKKYKESLALMVDCIPDEDGYVHVRPQDIFPELRESEDERIRKRIIHALHGDVLDMEETKEAIAWLEKQGKPSDEIRKKWSEEDECFMEYINAIATKDGWSFEEKRNIKHWLQSIKERYTWKPSDAQMKALDSTAGIVGILTPTGANLRSLYKDLEKLKGE